MIDVFDYPLLILVGSLVVFGGAAWVGFGLRRRGSPAADGSDTDFTFVLGGTLTLLGLLAGFTFSMAVGRYDQRKNLEEAEANAIGTEYVRLDLLTGPDVERLRDLLRRYVDARIRFYTTRDERELGKVDAETAQLQGELWAGVARGGAAQPNAVTALAVQGMNDVLNSQGYTQAAYWNRIPRAAWLLLVAIAIFCNFLIGFGAHARRASSFLVMPIALSITLFLIADIESPRGGVILVRPQNLESLAVSLKPR
jgi:hypothetical protein